MGFYLRKKETGHAGGRAVLCWARTWRAHWVGRGIWPCWARWAGLGVGFGSARRAVLCWAGRVGRRFGSAWRARLGWAWDLAVVGSLGWLGVGFGCGGRAVLCWARCAGPGWAQIWLCLARSAGWDLAVLGALGWVGRGVWLWWARWAELGVGFGRAGRAAGLGGVWFWWARCAVLGADLAFCVWSTLYMSSSCLPDVFVFIFMCISNGIMGLE